MSDIIENGQLSQKQRIDLVKSFLMESEIELISETEMPNSFHGFSVRIMGKELKLSILTKNVVNSGWVEILFSIPSTILFKKILWEIYKLNLIISKLFVFIKL